MGKMGQERPFPLHIARVILRKGFKAVAYMGCGLLAGWCGQSVARR